MVSLLFSYSIWMGIWSPSPGHPSQSLSSMTPKQGQTWAAPLLHIWQHLYHGLPFSDILSFDWLLFPSSSWNVAYLLTQTNACLLLLLSSACHCQPPCQRRSLTGIPSSLYFDTFCDGAVDICILAFFETPHVAACLLSTRGVYVFKAYHPTKGGIYLDIHSLSKLFFPI